jgi:hypothetical protein
MTVASRPFWHGCSTTRAARCIGWPISIRFVDRLPVSEERDLEDRPDQPAASPVPRAASPVRQAPISPEWRTTTRRGAYATMILALTLGYTWISATRDWGWPLLPSATLLIAGIYVFLTTYFDRLPAIFGRDRPVDHSTKYTLWFDGFSQAWSIDEDDPSKLNLRAILTFLNGGNQIIQFTVEQLELEVVGADSVSRTSFTDPFRLLPNRGKSVWPPALSISEGKISGTIRYAMKYEPPSGFPSYRRTHVICFTSAQPITGDFVANSAEPNVLDWWDLKPEEDEDLP